MPLDFGLCPKKLRKFCNFFSKNFDFIWKIFEFFFCISTCFKWFPTPKKNLLEKKKEEILQLFFQKNFDFIWKKFEFFFCISTCYKWFPTKKHAKIIIAADFGTSGGYTHVKSISVSRNPSYDEWIEYVKVKSKRESCKL